MNSLISWNLGGLKRWFLWNCFNNSNIFFSFVTHFKSSSSTTSRELRLQFAACSGWRCQYWSFEDLSRQLLLLFLGERQNKLPYLFFTEDSYIKSSGFLIFHFLLVPCNLILESGWSRNRPRLKIRQMWRTWKMFTRHETLTRCGFGVGLASYMVGIFTLTAWG